MTINLLDKIEVVKRRIALAAERVGRNPDGVTLIGITKNAAPIDIRQAFNAGVDHFGENRVKEAEHKIFEIEELRGCITWHMIGHLQTNKIKNAVQVFDIIHTIDTVGLGEKLDQQLRRNTPVLLEVNVADESTKNGFSITELSGAVKVLGRCSNLDIVGLMTIAPVTDEPETIRWVFRTLKQLADCFGLKELSMGMTGDFEIAVEEGSTFVRVGRGIFDHVQQVLT